MRTTSHRGYFCIEEDDALATCGIEAFEVAPQKCDTARAIHSIAPSKLPVRPEEKFTSEKSQEIGKANLWKVPTLNSLPICQCEIVEPASVSRSIASAEHAPTA